VSVGEAEEKKRNMILPNVEETPILLMRFTSKASQTLITLVREQLCAEGLIVLSSSSSSSDARSGANDGSTSNTIDQQDEGQQPTILALTTRQEKLEEYAERIRLMKLTSDTNIVDYFTVEKRRRFCCQGKSKNNNNKKKHTDDATNFRDKYGLFTANEWYLLITGILQTVSVLPPGQTETPLSRLLDQYHAEYRVHLQVVHQEEGDDDEDGDDGGGDDDGNDDGDDDENNLLLEEPSSNTFRIRKRMARRRRRRLLKEYGERSAVLCHVLQTYNLVDVITPIHVPAVRNEILALVLKQPWYPFYDSESTVNAIQSYFGWEVAFYFAWMGFTSRWLFFPGILGLCFHLFRRYRQDVIDDDEYTPFYGLIVFVWSILFLRFWERYEQRLAYRFGTFAFEAVERHGLISTRLEFVGYIRISPITLQPEMYYPAIRRRFKYVFSAIVTILMLMVAFSVMILSLNLQGYIHPKTNPRRWKKSPHPFYFESWAALAEVGQLLDATSLWRCYIPVVLHVVCIMTLNAIYRRVAERLTDFENHETVVSHNNSLIVKRFVFEFCDCCVVLFYLAFYERNIQKLMEELIAVFQVDTARRVFIECFVPFLLRRLKTGHFTMPTSHYSGSCVAFAAGSNTTPTTTSPPSLNDLLEEADKDPYEMFDDVMEMCIQLGYVTLFASAYPLASIVSIFANYIELRSDAFKISTLVMKPSTYRTSGFGMWNTLISCILWTSALTNCLIVGFSSDQLEHYLPHLYAPDDESDYSDLGQSEKSWILVFIIFGLERCLLIFGLLVYAIVPKGLSHIEVMACDLSFMFLTFNYSHSHCFMFSPCFTTLRSDRSRPHCPLHFHIYNSTRRCHGRARKTTFSSTRRVRTTATATTRKTRLKTHNIKSCFCPLSVPHVSAFCKFIPGRSTSCSNQVESKLGPPNRIWNQQCGPADCGHNEMETLPDAGPFPQRSNLLPNAQVNTVACSAAR
jgi:Calcium-activated chloride channel